MKQAAPDAPAPAPDPQPTDDFRPDPRDKGQFVHVDELDQRERTA